MNRAAINVVGIAAIACAACVTARAQSRDAAIDFYGIVDVGIVHEAGAAAGAVTRQTGGVMSGSRWGLRGRENLGGGLSAVFTLEGGFLTHTGAAGQGGLLFGRQAYVGVDSARFGRLTFGRQYTTLAIAQVTMDPFGTGLAGTSANLISAGGHGGSNRMNNAIKYELPKTPGRLYGEISYSLGGVPGSIVANSQFGASLGYNAGKLDTIVAYAGARNADGRGHDAREVFFGAKYDFDVATAYLNYVLNRGAIVPGTVNHRSQDFLIGTSVRVGTDYVLASCIYKDDRTADRNDARQFALGYVHNLSKRTSLYASYAHIWNRASNTATSGFYRVWNATDVGNPAAGNSAFNLGINHRF
ncbi:porin [Burkholderia ubonensis]|uniref:porin n=1 Tax=Burkholderia ubonensis TaxID=101571 RepID=UPI00075A67D8|nr:porin [Burkholderia ubonensis]